MASNLYLDLDTYKQYFNITKQDRDAAILDALEATSRLIDDITGTRFYATAATTLYYTAVYSDMLFIHDLISITSLKTDEDGDRTYEVTWQSTDYDLLPHNASYHGLPYTHIQTTPEGSYAFPKGVKKGIEIVGSWGYSATTPPRIKQACRLGARRLMARDDTPLGIGGAPALGNLEIVVEELKTDPDFNAMLQGPWMRVI